MIAGADGPYGGGDAECTKCGIRKKHDIYVYNSRVVCGDCRYELRHGFPPRYEPGNDTCDARKVADELIRRGSDYDGATKTVGRFLPTEVVSVKHAEVLLEIERENQLAYIE